MALLRTLFPLRHVESGMVLIAGNFTINGTSDPDNIVLKGVDSVSRDGVGSFTFQLPGKGSYDMASAGATSSVLGMNVVATVASTGVVTVETYGLSANALIDPTDDSVVYVEVLLSDTSVARK